MFICKKYVFLLFIGLQPIWAATSFSGNDIDILNMIETEIEGKNYSIIKYLDKQNKTIRRITLDADGFEVAIPKKTKTYQDIIDDVLKEKIASANSDATTSVLVTLKSDYTHEPFDDMTTEIKLGTEPSTAINGNVSSLLDFKAVNQKRQKQLDARIKKKEKHLKRLLENVTKKMQIYNQEMIDRKAASLSRTFELTLPLDQVYDFAKKYENELDYITLAKQKAVLPIYGTDLGATNLDDPVMYNYPISSRGNRNIDIFLRAGKVCPNASYFNQLPGHALAYPVSDFFDENRYSVEGTIQNSPIEHMTHNALAAAVINHTSPDSDIICHGANSSDYVSDFLSASRQRALGIDIEVQSYGDSVKQNYSDSDRAMDEHILDVMTPTFVAAGNEEDNFLCPAMANNAITVGAYASSTHSLAAYSSWKELSTQTEKPEIIAPADAWYNLDFNCYGSTQGLTENDYNWDNHPNDCWASGTSFAAPHAAGFFADIMSQTFVGDWLENRPHAAKAMMMALADNANGDLLDEKSGAGLIDFDQLQHVVDFGYYDESTYGFTIEGSNSMLNSDKTFSVNLHNHKTVKIVLAWLNDGDYFKNTHQLSMDLDMVICPSTISDPFNNYSQCAGHSFSSVNTVEMIEFNTGSQGGYYSIHVRRVANNDTDMETLAAIVLTER